MIFSFSSLFYFPGGHGQVGITPKSCHRVADRSKKVETLKQELGNTLSRSGKYTFRKWEIHSVPHLASKKILPLILDEN